MARLSLGLLALSGPALADTGLDRLTRRDEVFGWEAVGRLDFGTSGFCTGTLIATDMVLTAAHCLYDRARGALQPVETIRFRAGLQDGAVVAEQPALRAVMHPAYQPDAPMSEFSVRHDVALVQLAQPIPAAVAAPFVVRQPGSGESVSVVSYAQGREDALSWQRACRVLGKKDGLLAFNCDVDFGSSGAPVFDLSGGRGRIVSIISAGRKEGGGTVAFGMELPGLIEDLKAALRAGLGVMAAEAADPHDPPDRRGGRQPQHRGAVREALRARAPS